MRRGGLFGDRVLYSETPYGAAEGAHGLFLVTEWNHFRRPDWYRLRAVMRCPVLFDGRNLYDPEAVRRSGFAYYGASRGLAQESPLPAADHDLGEDIAGARGETRCALRIAEDEGWS
jgi:hypothetical protein